MISTWNVQYTIAVTIMRSFAGVAFLMTADQMSYTCMVNYPDVDCDQECDNIIEQRHVISNNVAF